MSRFCSCSSCRIMPVRLAFVAIVAAGAMTAQATVTTLAHWRLGEDDSGAVAGNTGNDQTTAAVGFDLDRGGDPTYSSNTPGPGSTLSMAFDGTGDVYSRGEPVTTATDFVGIEAWVYVTTLDTGGEDRIIAFNGDPDLNGWGLVQKDGALGGLLGAGVGGVLDSITQVDQWYHVAFVLDGTASFYLNGVTIGSTGTVPDAPTDPFLIGANNAGSGYFDGNIDHVRVFSFDDSFFDPETDLLLGIPEPSTFALAAIAAFGWRRRKR